MRLRAASAAAWKSFATSAFCCSRRKRDSASRYFAAFMLEVSISPTFARAASRATSAGEFGGSMFAFL